MLSKERMSEAFRFACRRLMQELQHTSDNSSSSSSSGACLHLIGQWQLEDDATNGILLNRQSGGRYKHRHLRYEFRELG
jgi:hypothetical protein